MKPMMFFSFLCIGFVVSCSAWGGVIRLEAEEASWFDGPEVGHGDWAEIGAEKVWSGLYRPCNGDPGYRQDRLYLNKLHDAVEKASCPDYAPIGDVGALSNGAAVTNMLAGGKSLGYEALDVSSLPGVVLSIWARARWEAGTSVTVEYDLSGTVRWIEFPVTAGSDAEFSWSDAVCLIGPITNRPSAPLDLTISHLSGGWIEFDLFAVTDDVGFDPVANAADGRIDRVIREVSEFDSAVSVADGPWQRMGSARVETGSDDASENYRLKKILDIPPADFDALPATVQCVVRMGLWCDSTVGSSWVNLYVNQSDGSIPGTPDMRWSCITRRQNPVGQFEFDLPKAKLQSGLNAFIFTTSASGGNNARMEIGVDLDTNLGRSFYTETPIAGYGTVLGGTWGGAIPRTGELAVMILSNDAPQPRVFGRPWGANLALSAAETASSEHTTSDTPPLDFRALHANDGWLDHGVVPGNSQSDDNNRWHTRISEPNTFPYTLDFEWTSAKTVSRVVVEHSDAERDIVWFPGHKVQVWTGSVFVDLVPLNWPSVSVVEPSSPRLTRVLEFNPVTTTKVRIVFEPAGSANYAQLTEAMIFGPVGTENRIVYIPLNIAAFYNRDIIRTGSESDPQSCLSPPITWPPGSTTTELRYLIGHGQEHGVGWVDGIPFVAGGLRKTPFRMGNYQSAENGFNSYWAPYNATSEERTLSVEPGRYAALHVVHACPFRANAEENAYTRNLNTFTFRYSDLFVDSTQYIRPDDIAYPPHDRRIQDSLWLVTHTGTETAATVEGVDGVGVAQQTFYLDPERVLTAITIPAAIRDWLMAPTPHVLAMTLEKIEERPNLEALSTGVEDGAWQGLE